MVQTHIPSYPVVANHLEDHQPLGDPWIVAIPMDELPGLVMTNIAMENMEHGP